MTNSSLNDFFTDFDEDYRNNKVSLETIEGTVVSKEDTDIRSKLDRLLDTTDYSNQRIRSYVPSKETLRILAFKQQYYPAMGQTNKTSIAHLIMLDSFVAPKDRGAVVLLDDDSEVIANPNLVLNLCSRGIAKTTITEIFTLYLAAYPFLKGLEKQIYSAFFMGDSIEGGAKTFKKSIDNVIRNSTALQTEVFSDYNSNENEITFVNTNGHMLNMALLGANTSIRGKRSQNVRPQVGIMDDIVREADGFSILAHKRLTNMISAAVMPAMDIEYKLLWNGTPFHSEDVLVKAVESGTWTVNVLPIAEKFPVVKDNYKSVWSDRFTYEFLAEKYNDAKAAGTLAQFYREYFLRIAYSDQTLVADKDINFYDRTMLTEHYNYFTWVITVDFAVTEKESADSSVLSLWAINKEGRIFLVTGSRHKSGMGVTMDDLFKLVAWCPVTPLVSLEVSGQQKGFIEWIEREMIRRNVYFDLARDLAGNIGFSPSNSKLERFYRFLPNFERKIFYFPNQEKATDYGKNALKEIKGVTPEGITTTKDFLDTMTMLSYIDIPLPSRSFDITDISKNRVESQMRNPFHKQNIYHESEGLSSYLGDI